MKIPSAPITLTAGHTYFIGAYFGLVVDRCGTACGDASLVFGSETYAPGIAFLLSNQTRAIIGSGPLAFRFGRANPRGLLRAELLDCGIQRDTTPEPASLAYVSPGVVALLIASFWSSTEVS